MSELNEPLPELRDATLDAQGLEELLRELRVLTQLFEVRVKGTATTRGASVEPSLDGVRGALRAGAAVQIRYEYDGGLWCDTLMPVPGGVRLIRSSS